MLLLVLLLVSCQPKLQQDLPMETVEEAQELGDQVEETDKVVSEAVEEVKDSTYSD